MVTYRNDVFINLFDVRINLFVFCDHCIFQQRLIVSKSNLINSIHFICFFKLLTLCLLIQDEGV